MTQFMAFFVLAITIFLISGMPVSGSGQNQIQNSDCKSHIVFEVQTEEKRSEEIYGINPDNTGLHEIVKGGNFISESGFSMSSDGQQIGFATHVGDNTYLPYVVNIDGTGLRSLVASMEFSYYGAEWSPDGQWLLSETWDDITDTNELHLIGLNNSELIKIQSPNNYQLHVGSAGWSPDGKEIALAAAPEDANSHYDIYLISVEDAIKGTHVSFIKLTNGDYDSPVGPRWSPTGDQIAFASNRNGNYDIFVMDRDGTNPIRLTSSNENDLVPVWSPDGQRIAYQNSGNLYIINSDGTNPKLIYHDIGGVYDWSPDSTRMVITTPESPKSNPNRLKIVYVDTGETIDLRLNSIGTVRLLWSVEWSACIL